MHERGHAVRAMKSHEKLKSQGAEMGRKHKPCRPCSYEVGNPSGRTVVRNERVQSSRNTRTRQVVTMTKHVKVHQPWLLNPAQSPGDSVTKPLSCLHWSPMWPYCDVPSSGPSGEKGDFSCIQEHQASPRLLRPISPASCRVP